MAFLLYFLRIILVGSYENYKRFVNYVFPSVPMNIFLHLYGSDRKFISYEKVHRKKWMFWGQFETLQFLQWKQQDKNWLCRFEERGKLFGKTLLISRDYKYGNLVQINWSGDGYWAAGVGGEWLLAPLYSLLQNAAPHPVRSQCNCHISHQGGTK